MAPSFSTLWADVSDNFRLTFVTLSTNKRAMSKTECRPPAHFQWIEEGRIAAFAFPSKAAHLRWLRNAGIKHLVSLQAYPDPPISEVSGIKWTRIDIPEFSPPTMDQANQFVELVDNSLGAGEAVGVHCTFGMGRTGTLLACWLGKTYGLRWKDAIERLRAMRPWSIETWEQELSVRAYLHPDEEL